MAHAQLIIGHEELQSDVRPQTAALTAEGYRSPRARGPRRRTGRVSARE
jgi:hypothetical protein